MRSNTLLSFSLENAHIPIWDCGSSPPPPFPLEFDVGTYKASKPKVIVVWRGSEPGVYGY
jgi:hypothetical protein